MNFILANSAHNEQLRRIVRAESMPGHIQVAYEREPDFFQGLETQGTFNQIVAAEEGEQLIGFGCRSIRPMFINGERIDFGYLSGLRSSLEAKRRLGIARGYKTFKELHADGRCPGYITTIIDGNAEAISTIAQGRAGLPFYKELGSCITAAIALKKRNKAAHPHITVRFARPGEESTVIRLLETYGKYYQFFPALTEANFGTPLLRDLPITKFLIAEQHNEPCGIAALWDQSAFKQHRIKQYSSALKLARPLLNAGLKLNGRSPLPNEGTLLLYATFCFKAVKDSNPDILRALLQFACKHLHHAGYSHCITGFHQNDSGLGILKYFSAIRYHSRLFFAGWEDDLEIFNQLDRRTPYFDPAIL